MEEKTDMDGMQKTIYLRLQVIIKNIQEGEYGTDDEIDVDYIETDLTDVTADM